MAHCRTVVVSAPCLIAFVGCSGTKGDASGVLDDGSGLTFNPKGLKAVRIAQNATDPLDGPKGAALLQRSDKQAYQYTIDFYDGTSLQGVANIVIPCSFVSVTDSHGNPVTRGSCHYQDPANGVGFDMEDNTYFAMTWQGVDYPASDFREETFCGSFGMCGGQ